MAIETKLKRWGNSFAVLLPKPFIEKKHLKENDTIFIEVVEKADLSSVFGSLKGKNKLSGQKFKDMVREGWK